jgi:hypothetical protein
MLFSKSIFFETVQAFLEGKTIWGKTIKALGQWFCP